MSCFAVLTKTKRTHTAYIRAQCTERHPRGSTIITAAITKNIYVCDHHPPLPGIKTNAHVPSRALSLTQSTTAHPRMVPGRRTLCVVYALGKHTMHSTPYIYIDMDGIQCRIHTIDIMYMYIYTSSIIHS